MVRVVACRRWLPREVDGVRVMNLTWEQQLQYKPAADPALVQVEMPWVQVSAIRCNGQPACVLPVGRVLELITCCVSVYLVHKVVTWNDWPEGTTVEPAAAGSIAASGTGNASGYVDLLQCRQGSFVFKGLSDGGAAQRASDGGLSIVQIPLWILEARHVGRNDLANASIALLARGLYENASAVAQSWRCSGVQRGCDASCKTCRLDQSSVDANYCQQWQCLDVDNGPAAIAEFWSALVAGIAVLLR